MNNTCLIQYAVGAAHERMLEITHDRHARLCKDAGVDFWCDDKRFPANKRPTWHKVDLIIEALYNKGYDKVIWLDADCVIESNNIQPMIDACKGIGMVIYPSIGEDPLHFNCGAIYAGKDLQESVRAILSKWAMMPENDHPWADQKAFNDLFISISKVDWLNQIKRLSPKFNYLDGYFDAPNPIVRSFHGVELNERISRMEKCVDALQK